MGTVTSLKRAGPRLNGVSPPAVKAPSTTVISGREVGALALVAGPSPGLDATIGPITDFQLNWKFVAP